MDISANITSNEENTYTTLLEQFTNIIPYNILHTPTGRAESPVSILYPRTRRFYAEPILTTRSMVNIPFTLPSQNRSQTRSNISTVMEESLYEKPKYKKVVSDKGMENIKFELYNEKSEKQSKVCAITREKFKDQEEVAILPCNHIFNKEAILTWLTTKNAECPICRYKLESKEIKCEREGENIGPQETINTDVNITIQNMQNIIVNLLNEQIQEEEDANIQRAIIASLQNTLP